MYKKIKIKDIYGKIIDVKIMTLSNEYLNKILKKLQEKKSVIFFVQLLHPKMNLV